MHFKELSYGERFHLLWRSKYLILLCACAGAVVGLTVASLLPQSYQTNVVARPAGTSEFTAFSELLPYVEKDWQAPGNIAGRALQIFLNYVRDRNDWRYYILSHRDLFSRVNLDDPDKLNDVVVRDFSIDPASPRDTTDNSMNIHFLYRDGTSGANILNGFVESAIAKTKSKLYLDGQAILTAIKKNKESELVRRREAKDLANRQAILTYQQALDTAQRAGIEKSVVTNAGSPVTVINGQVPTYQFGTIYIAAELKHFQERIGNDLAIPEFADLTAGIEELGRKLNLLESSLDTPILISQSAVDIRAIFPPWTPIVLICFSIGAGLGSFWGYARLQKLAAKPQADLPTSVSPLGELGSVSSPGQAAQARLLIEKAQ
jgi:LPS O-antigen subunit length determinant protein (WzzB/FepE family)